MFKDSDHGPDGSIDLFDDAIAADGDPTDLTRERPNGRFLERDAADTGFGVDRNASGRFASQDRTPVPTVRHDDGEFGADGFAIGNVGRFDDDGRFDTLGGDRR